jgi:methionyl-tRNA formyltransferase
VVTEPDKPTGRKMEILPTPVKAFALSRGLKVFQPEKKINVFEVVKELKPDICVVAAYGKIITKETLDIPKYGCINFHASLLPKLRGASPIQSAILQMLDKTGVTIMVMDENMDTGPILSQIEIPIENKETTTTLREKMLISGLPLLVQTVSEYIEGKIKPIAQEEGDATYCKMIEKEDGHIDFSKSAEQEYAKLRAFNEWPGAFCFWNDKRLKMIDANTVMNHESGIMNYELGEVFLDENKNLCLDFAKGYWIIEKLQLEGKSMVSAKDFLNGNKDFVGAVLS